MKRRNQLLSAAIAATASTWAVSPLATAQEGGAVLEEIIVTATQRARSVQDIPVSVNMLGGEELEMAGVTDVGGLNQMAPTFYMTSTTSETIGTTARIRGIGTQGNNPGLESAVGIFIDGVYRNRTAVGFTDLGRVDRIEVLRGPQGTLFGRNTSAGLVHVITQQPQFDETDAYVKLSAGNYGYAKVDGGVSGGSTDLAAGLDFTYTKRDGFFEDELSGEEHNDRDRYALRGQLVFDPSDDLSVRLIADYGERDETCCAAMYTEKGLRTSFAIEQLSPQQLTNDVNDVFDRDSYTTPGRTYDTEVEEYGLSGQVDWNIGELAFTSITAYRDWDARNAGDLDYSGADLIYRDTDDYIQEFETFTQEFRLNGQLLDGDLDWLVGMFYGDETLDHTLGTKVGADYQAYVEHTLGAFAAVLGGPGTPLAPIPLPWGPASGDGASDLFTTETESLAFFTHNTWRPMDNLELTLGLRWTSEEKDFDGEVATTGDACAIALAAGGYTGVDGPRTPITGPLDDVLYGLYCLGGTLNHTLDGTYTDNRDEEDVSGTVAASYYFTDQLMGYVSYANGYKSGGFNLDRSGLDPDTVTGGQGFDIDRDVAALEFEEETVDSYELGVKATFAGGTTTLNATYFYQDFENFQLNTFNGLTFFVVTLDEVTSQGVEVDLRTTIGDNLSLTAGLLWNEAEYADDVTRSDGAPATNLAGQQMTHAPEWSATGAATYDFQLGNLNAFAHLDFRFTDEHNTGSDLDPEKVQDAFTVWNGRVGVRSADETWTAELWARNLTDEDYYQVVFDSPSQNFAGVQPLESYSAYLGDPRTFGVTVGYNF
ncbi:TonB-dependent receptor [Gilvimarinus sp. F26214L]|uniref:TonB-dependent receptor n=1 Tax=Gilvimarinus sp. DZF01 TaxID=3461371 RepID=UPI00404589A0